MVIYLLLVQTLLHLTVGEYPLICPGKSHWNLRASKVCRKIDDYRCLWDVNNEVFVEQCEGYYAQIKGYRKVIEGDINAGDCSPNTYQPREWTTEKNFDCEFEKSSCNELGQIVYDDGDSLSDRSCRCDYTAGYVFLQKPKHLCYCVPSVEDCTCVQKRCPPGHKLDPEYECRPSNKWQILFRCPELPYGASSTVSPEEEITTITEVSEKAFPNKSKAIITLAVILVLLIDSFFTKRLSETTVYEGETAKFSCEVNDGKLEVIWFVNGEKVIPENPRYQMLSNGRSRVLEINNVHGSDDGKKITAKVGYEKTFAILVVKDSLIKSRLKQVIVYEGETARFSCEVKHEEIEVIWSVNGEAATIEDRYKMESDGCVRELLIYNALKCENWMKITATVHAEISTATLMVKDSVFTKKLSDTTVNDGETALFSCEIINEKMEVTWFVNDEEVSPNNQQYNVISNGCIKGLEINDVKRSNKDIQITVMVGNEKSSATLVVKDIEIILLTGKKIVIGFGSTALVSAQIICGQQKADLITVNWQKVENNVPVSLNLNTVKYSGSSLNLPTPELVINEAEQEDAGVYQLNVVSTTSTLTSEPVVVELYGDLVESISKEERNFLRFSLLCQHLGSKAVLLYFNKHVSNLSAHLNTHRSDLHYITGNRTWKCNQEQFNILFPVSPAVAKASDFDISLIYKLIRNTINVNPPTQGWGKTPLPGNVSEEDDIERVRYYRNELTHNTDFKIQDGDFNSMWDDLSECLKRLGGIQLASDINSLKSKAMDNKTKNEVIGNIKHLKEDVELEVQKMKERLDNPIPSNIQEQFKKIVDKWIADDEMFVPTQAAKDVMTKIKEHNFVVVTGNSGTGKTYTVRHIALMMEKEGYIIVPAVVPEDISKYFKHGCKTVFVFDDLCGRFTLNQNYLNQWKLYNQNLKTILNDKSCKILASCRLQVSTDVKMKEFFSEIQRNECKMGTGSLSTDERRKMVEKYFNQIEITITDEMLCEFDFLPFLCSVLRNKDISELEKCFQNPFSFFGEELEKLYLESDDGKLKYCALLLCVLYNNTLTQNALKQKDEVLKSIYTDVLEECELAPTEPLSKMQNALQSLNDVYITIADGTYIINHDKLFDYMAKYFGEKMIDVFIKFADSGFIRERFCIESTETSRHSSDCISVPVDKLKPFIERLITDWKSGEVQNVFCNTNMESVNFRQRLLYHLKELDESFQRDLVRKQDKAHGDTPLFKLCMYNDLQFTRWLLDLGADVNLGCNNKFSPLQVACVYNNEKVVKILLTYEQIDIDHRDINGRTALFMACEQGNVEIVKVLVQNKADLNIGDNYQSTPFFVACINGHHEVVSILMKLNVDVNKCIHSGLTPLMLACFHNHLEVVKMLLNCKKTQVNHSANDGCTALHLACMRGNVEIVIELIRHTVDINICDVDGYTPFMIACLCSHLDNTNEDFTIPFREFVTKLVKRRQSKDDIDKVQSFLTQLSISTNTSHLEVVKELLKCKRIDVKHCAKDGWTAIHFACMAGNAEIVKELLLCDVDINASKEDGWTPLMLACFNSNLEVVKELLKCKQTEVAHTANNGMSAIHLACMAGNSKIVSELMHLHVDINSSENDGWTPLMLALKNNHLEVAKVLLMCKNIDVKKKSKDGLTTIHLASMEGDAEIVKELLRHNIDINITKEDGWTPLMLACFNNNLEVVKELLKCKQIDVAHSANNGRTAIHLACMAGDAKIVSELIQRHVDINSSENRGWTPLMLALQHNHLEVVKVLLKYKKINVYHIANNGLTAFHVACIAGNTEMIGVLIQRNVDINMFTKDDFTPLMLACLNNQMNVVKILLNCKQIKVNLSTKSGDTALHFACMRGNVGIVTELLQHNVNINSCNVNGMTPLMNACFCSDLDLVLEDLKSKQTNVGDSTNDSLTASFSKCVTEIFTKEMERIQNNVDIDMVEIGGFTIKNNNLEVVQVLLKCKKIDINYSSNDGTAALHLACVKGNVQIVIELIQNDVDINRIVRDGMSPLTLACYFNRIKVVRVLLECEKIDVNHSNNDGWTALHLACDHGYVEIVTELLHRNAEINQRTKGGVTPLLIACFKNHLEVVKILLKCEQIDVDHSADQGETAIYVACENGNEKIVTELIQCNTDINRRTKNGSTPLMAACLNNHLDVVKMLLKCEQIKVNHRHDDGTTVLHLACEEGNENIVTELIRCNADINRIRKNGLTPLMVACANNHLEVVKVLLRCEHIDVNNRNDDGITALFLACQKGNAGIVTELIKNNVDINIIRKDGVTPLILSCFKNHLDVVKVLLKCKQIDVDHSTDHGQTALHVACQEGNENIVTELIRCNTDINWRKRNGLTPLMVACANNHLEVVKVLLRCEHIDVNNRNDDGITALFLACQKWNAGIVTELIKNNVDINIIRKDGVTPLILSCFKNHLDVVKVLLKCKQIDVDHSADQGQTALHVACQEGNENIVTELIRCNADINRIRKNGLTPLMAASLNNHFDVVKVLLNCEQIDVNNSNDDGTTALHLACQEGNAGIVTELIKNNVDINSARKDGVTPLMVSCFNNHLDVVKVLLKCEQIDVDHSTDQGQTALHVACQEGNEKIVTELIKCNTDINRGTKNGLTPLMTACLNNHFDVVKVLLKCKQIDANQSNDDGITALYLACLKGNAGIVSELIKNNVDINMVRKNGETPLMVSCFNNHLDVVKVLLKSEQIAVDRITYNGCTSLYLACQKGNKDIVKLLVRHQVDVNRGVEENRPKALVECIKHHTDEFKRFLNSQNTRPIDQTELFKQIPDIWFCQTVHTKVVRELAKNPRDVKTCKMDVCFPLEVACSCNRIDVVKELLKCPDIEINRCTSYGQTALYWACIQRHVDSMAVLLKHNADVNISDINGISPLHIACWASNKEAVKLLIAHGANKTLKDINGKTPADIAVEDNDQECLSILNQS